MVNKQYTIQHQNARRSNSSGTKRFSPPPVRNHSAISDTPSPNFTNDSNLGETQSQKNLSLDTITEEQASRSGAFGRNISLYSQQFSQPPARQYGFGNPSAQGATEEQRYADEDLSIINDIGRFQYILQMDKEMGTHPESIYRIPSRTAASSKSNSINSSNHVNFWKADSELPITATTTQNERRLYIMQKHFKDFWKYAKWPLALILACILLGVLIYFLAGSRINDDDDGTMMNIGNNGETVDGFHPAQTIIGEERPTETKNILEAFQSNTKAVNVLAGIKPTQSVVMKSSRIPSSPATSTTFRDEQTRPPLLETTKMSTQSTSTSVETTVRMSSSKATASPPTKTTVNVILNVDKVSTKLNPSPPPAQTTVRIISPKIVMKNISFGTTTKLLPVSAEIKSTTASTSAATTPTLPPFRNTQIVKISPQETEDSPKDEDDYVGRSTTEITDKDGKSFAPTKDTVQVIGFTSGHQNNFGIPIEEDERILKILNEELIKNGQNETFDFPTTDSTVTKVRVSPTLPIIHRLEGTTERDTSIQNTTDVRMCRSTSLGICRGILRYDLTTISARRDLSPLDLEHFKYLIDSKCSVRAAEFVCSALEPECRPTQMGILQPCKRICKSILEPCASIIASSEILTTTFDCDSYPDSSDRNVCEDPTRRGKCYENEFKCLDSTCIPLQWKCDNIKDCSLGEDEDNCLFCEHEEFRCQSIDKCIPDKWRCDQYNDCPDGSDECDCFDYEDAGDLSEDDFSGPRIYSFSSVQSPDDPDSRPYLTISEEDRLTDVEKQDDRPFPPTAEGSAEYANENQTNEASLKDENEEIQNGAASGRVIVGVPENLANFQDSKEIMMTSDSETDYKYSSTNETSTQRTANDSINGTESGSLCPENKLRCVSGKCITVEQICDKTIDCPDGADEAMCVYKET